MEVGRERKRRRNRSASREDRRRAPRRGDGARVMQTSLDLSLRAAAVHRIAGRRVVASISGGRDSAAMSLHLTELGIEHDRVFMDTGWESQITYDYLRGPLTDKLGPITEIRGALDFVQLVEKKGLFPSRVMRFCTEELKVKPVQRWLNHRRERFTEDDDVPASRRDPQWEIDIVNTVGIRRAESRARSQMAEWEWSEGFDLEVWRPLVAWTAEDVRAIHMRHGLATNPLYDLGASRVGCWPCIHARKSEIALVARLDPARIDRIREIERGLNERGAERDAEKGRPFRARSMFNFHGGDNHHIPLTIDEAVEWGNSARGEWQPPGDGDGCMRWGVCDTGSETG
jgi:3'-phosphoadenosine 5'-phosphosulfate sulfotransferase (PAPS reductase)/FAD synthetase